MIDSIRHVVSSSSGTRVVFGAFERDVEIWDLAEGTYQAGFEACFDFGGSRLALSDELNTLISGAYRRFGVTGYDASTGRAVWRRPDLKKVQRLSLSRDGRTVFCGREGSPCEVLCIATGDSVKRLRATATVYGSRFEASQLFVGRRLRLQPAESDAAVLLGPADAPPVLDAVFARGKVVISWCAGAVECFSTATADRLWSYSPGPGRHVLDLGYRPGDDVAVAAEWGFERGGPISLVALDMNQGEVVLAREIGRDSDVAFCQDGRSLVGSSRRVISTVTARPISILDINPPDRPLQPTSGGQAGVE